MEEQRQYFHACVVLFSFVLNEHLVNEGVVDAPLGVRPYPPSNIRDACSLRTCVAMNL